MLDDFRRLAIDPGERVRAKPISKVGVVAGDGVSREKRAVREHLLKHVEELLGQRVCYAGRAQLVVIVTVRFFVENVE